MRNLLPIWAALGAFVLFGGWSVPGAGASRLVIEGNLISQNGIGIYVGWIGDWEIHIEANKIVQNGEGVRIKNRQAVILRNLIGQNVIGIVISLEHQEQQVVEGPLTFVLMYNAFEVNELYAIRNDTPFVIKADRNWWGSPEGPRLERSFPNGLLGLIELSTWLIIPPF